MPDHAPRPTREPPWIYDRARTNILSLRDSALGILGGALIATDALIPDTRWLASHALAAIPHWVQILIASLLIIGGLITPLGVLIRSWRGRKIAPLTTILMEKIGWLLLTAGWATTAVSTLGNARDGSTLSLCIMTALALGAACKLGLLWQLERQVRGEVRARAQTAAALEKLRGDA